jgi:hypothetical protein
LLIRSKRTMVLSFGLNMDSTSCLYWGIFEMYCFKAVFLMKMAIIYVVHSALTWNSGTLVEGNDVRNKVQKAL